MKKIIRYVLIISIIGLFFGCNLTDKQTKQECVDSFLGKAQNGNWGTMYKEIHPDNNNRSSYVSGDTFQGIYDDDSNGYGNISYSIDSESGDTLNVRITYESGNTRTETFKFRVEEETMFGDDTWLIYSFTDENGVIR